MSIHNITNSNALLLYKVGPVLVCTPTLYIESITIPPNLNSLPGSNHAEPGMFKSMHGMVRVVDLRVRFGVDVADRKSPGRIVISETTGGYVGLWVDEIEDVVSFPEKGWSQLPAHVPREAFSRALICDEGIRLYADIENLDKFKATGYLRAHIENIKSREVSAKKLNKNSSVAQGFIREKIEKKQEEEVLNDKVSDEKKSAITYESATISYPVQYDIPVPGNNIEENKGAAIKGALSAGKKFDKKTGKKTRKENEFKKEGVTVNPVARSKTISPHQKHVVFDKNNNTENRRVQSKEYSTFPSDEEKILIEDESRSNLLWVSVFALSFIAASIYVIEFSGMFDINVNSISKDGSRREVFVEEDDVSISNKSDDYYMNEINELPDYTNDTVDISKTDEGIVIVINDYEQDLSEEELDNHIKNDEEELNENKNVEDSLELDADAIEVVAAVDGIEDLNKMLVVNSEVEEATEKYNDNYMSIVTVQEGDFNLLKETDSLLSPSSKSNEETVDKIVKTLTSIHIVIAGDTLWDIAKKYVYDPWKYPELARLSKIKDPDLIYPGQKVTIIYNTNK